MAERRPPNILFFFPDQWRPDWLGCVGRVPVRTPVADGLAARGVRFTRAYCTAPLCAPSRASLAAGMRPHRVGVHDNGQDFPLTRDTCYQHLRETGYRVAACGKTDLHKPTHVNGPDGWTRRMGILGFTETVDQAGKWDAVNNCHPVPHDPYTRYLAEHGLLETHCHDFAKRRAQRPKQVGWASPLPREHHTDDFCGRAGVRLLEGFPAEAPWFLQVNFPSPHEPMDAPAELLERWAGESLPGPIDADDHMTAAEHLDVRRNYAALCEGVDEWCGRMLDVVARRGELEHTLVVFASDHGEMLGDHGRWGKSTFYEPSVGVPLIVAGPGVAGAGETSDALVELPDVAALFLETAGVPVPAEWEARSLAPVLRGETDEHREVVVSMLPGQRALVTERYKLVVRDGQIPALFDRDNDPDELRNIASDHPEIVLPMAERLGEETGTVSG